MSFLVNHWYRSRGKVARFYLVDLLIFDFDGVFTDNTVNVDQDGKESVQCWRSDGIGLSRLRNLGVQLAMLSTEINKVVAARSEKLDVFCQQSVEDKGAAIEGVCAKFGVDATRTMFVGNDVNDISAFDKVAFPVAVADAYPEVLPHVCYKTRAPGGHGAVREICDLVADAILENGNGDS